MQNPQDAIQRPVTLDLPVSEIDELTRLAELSGTSFNQELVRDLAFSLEIGNHEPGSDAFDPSERLREIESLQEPWAPVHVALPAWEWRFLSDFASTHGTTPSKAMAGLTRRTVRSLLRLETRALERRQGVLEAWLDMLEEDTREAA